MRLPLPQQSYAILLGVSQYQSEAFPALPSVRNNVLGLAEMLTDPQRGGLLVERCSVLIDPLDVRSVYRQMRQGAGRASDTFFLYYAGHGRTGTRNELYLTLADTDPDELRVSALAFDHVRDIFVECAADNLVLVLDCCFSGRAINDMSGGKEPLAGAMGIEGTYTLASTPPNALALAPEGETYTAFTGELISLLRDGAPGRPELLTYPVVYRHLLARMRGRALPIPQQRGTGTVDQLALSRNVAHAAKSSGSESIVSLNYTSPGSPTEQDNMSPDTPIGQDFESPGISAEHDKFKSRKPIAAIILVAIATLAVAVGAWLALAVMDRSAFNPTAWMELIIMEVVAATVLVGGADELRRRAYTLVVHEYGLTRLRSGGNAVHLPWAALSSVEIRRLGRLPHLVCMPRPGAGLPSHVSAHPLWREDLHAFVVMDLSHLRRSLDELAEAFEKFSGGRYRPIGNSS